MVNKLKGTPLTPGEIHLLEAVQVGPEIEVDPTASAEDVGTRVHRTYLRREKSLKEYGYTKYCPGCEAARLGLQARGHSEACRRRIEEAMKASEAGQGHNFDLLLQRIK
eukprot:6492710-Amphidinium_carterae.2